MPSVEGGTYSQFDEDKILCDIISRLRDIPHTFVEIGCGDGSENNTRFMLECGWYGTWVDSDEANSRLARERNVDTIWCRVSRGFIPPLSYGSDLGVLSIDIDGNDYHVWEALHQRGHRPWIVVIEAQIQPHGLCPFPWQQPWVQDYDPNFVWDGVGHDNGASPVALIELGKKLGYEYWGKSANEHSPNLFFVKREALLEERLSPQAH